MKIRHKRLRKRCKPLELYKPLEGFKPSKGYPSRNLDEI